MISRGFEAVNTVFGGILVLAKKTRSLRERDVVKHGPYRTVRVQTKNKSSSDGRVIESFGRKFNLAFRRNYDRSGDYCRQSTVG